MRGRLLLVLGAAGCVAGAESGAASSTLQPEVQSATAIVTNARLEDPPGTYRLWTIGLTEDAPGTPCASVGDPVVTIELWTLFDSAPRGDIPVSPIPPPVVFPAAFVTIPDAIEVQGTVFISAAASTQLVGQLSGYVNIGGAFRAINATFDASVCGP